MAVALVESFDFSQVLNWGSSPARLRLGKSDCGVPCRACCVQAVGERVQANARIRRLRLLML
jgi:hypothetical protein